MGMYSKSIDPVRTKIMKSNKGKNNRLEQRLRFSLVSSGIKGFVLNSQNLPGSPDIAFPIQKVAIFINGCFWHRCPICKPKLPKTNRDFWENKFEANKKRDKLNNDLLLTMGWKVLVIWECEIKKDLGKCVTRILALIEYSSKD